MSHYQAVKSSENTDKSRWTEVNHNEERSKTDKRARDAHQLTKNFRSYTTEIIELPNDGRVEIVASRRFGKPVTSLRHKDEVSIAFDHNDTIHILLAPEQKSRVQNVLQSCGARVPHGPAVIDTLVSSSTFIYASMLALLVAHVRKDWRYLSILTLWFFWIILRVNTFNTLDARVSPLRRKIWHFSGTSFSIVFMYFTLVVAFPMLTRDAYYPPAHSEDRPSVSLIMSTLKASVGLALLGMAARRSFHCGKIISHMELISSILLSNFDTFNLVDSLNVKEGASPVVPKGSAMEISILVACEVSFLIIAFEALMPYSLITLDKQNVGQVKHKMSLKKTKEQAIVMLYPYSLLIQNLPILVIRLLLLVSYDIFQLAYVIKNVTSITLGAITLIRARSSLNKSQKKDIFLETKLGNRRVSI